MKPAHPVAWAWIRNVHPINHVFHHLMVMFTLGAWAPVWATWSVYKHDKRVAFYWSGGSK